VLVSFGCGEELFCRGEFGGKLGAIAAVSAPSEERGAT